MFDDLSLEPDTEGRAPPGPAFVASLPFPNNMELLITEQCFRNSAVLFPGAGEVIFVDVDDDTGAEMFSNAERFQVLMAWPRLPTLGEAIAWQRHQTALAENDCWALVTAPDLEASLAFARTRVDPDQKGRPKASRG